MAKNNIALFFTGFLQVFFVSVNTCFLAKEIYVGVLFAAFWSYNIKKIVFGTFTERIVYSLGATAGSLLGLYTSSYLIKIF